MTPPVFSHGSLRLYLLMLLDEQPRHGYELIQALSDRFGGTYVPSAGTIYPRLAKLEEEGLVTKETDGRKTVYAITDAGRAELAARQGDLHSIENEVSDSVRRLADEVRAGVNQAMKSLRADLASAAREARRDTATFVAGTGADTASDSTARAGGSENWSAGPRTNGATPSDGAAPEGSAPADDSHGGDSGNGGAPTAGAAAGVESRLALHDADLALTRFRQELRTELRKRATRGAVSRSAVELLERRLAEVRTEVLAALEASS